MRIDWELSDNFGDILSSNDFVIDNRDIASCKTRAEAITKIENRTKEEFKKYTCWYLTNRNMLCREIDDILEDTYGDRYNQYPGIVK